MLKAFFFDFDERKDEVRLTRVVDLTSYLKDNYEEKKFLGKGFSKGRGLRKIGSIPIDVLLAHGIDIHDDNAIRDFLRKHPEYRVSEGEI